MEEIDSNISVIAMRDITALQRTGIEVFGDDIVNDQTVTI